MRTVELTIQEVAFGGKGVARDGGKVVFVPLTIDGERISASITHEKKNFAEAEPLEVLDASPHRTQPGCPYFGSCGGCSYQHIDYEHQAALKWRQVRDTLRRIGKFEGLPLRPIIPSPLPYDYRNRITVHAEEGTIGFFRRDSRRLIDIQRCPIATEEVNIALKALRERRPRDGHYTLRADSNAPRIFTQANDVVAQSLKKLVEQIIPPNQKLLIDAYCGAGFFAAGLRDRFERIIGIDWDHFAIAAAAKEATATETYIAGDVAAELRAALANAPLSGTTVIVDPPATGLSANVRDTLNRSQPGTLIYISCNPPTLARDLAALHGSFEIESVTPLDMFPQTAEIEVAVHLRAKT